MSDIVPAFLQIESSIRRLTRRNFSKFDATSFESTLLSSELFTSPETDVDNFADQLERVITSALDAICPAKTRRVRLSRRRRSPLSAEAIMAKRRAGVWNVAACASVVKATK